MNLQIDVLDKVGAALVADSITVDDGNSVQVFNTTSSETPVIVDNSMVTITIVKVGYFTYTNAIRVYAEDESISIKMIDEITDPNDVDYMRPYAHFFIIHDPCSFEIHTYNGSSHPFGNWQYEINNSVFANTPNASVSVCEPGFYDITLGVSTSASSSSCGTVFIPAYEDEVTINTEVVEYRPDFTPNFDWDCCPTLSEIYSIDLSSYLWNNTVTGCITANITMRILDPTGNIVTTETYDYNDLIDTPIPIEDVDIEFAPTVLGTYKLEIDFENCCTTTSRSYDLEVCNNWIVQLTECNIVQITNLSSSVNLTYTIKALNNDNNFEVVTLEEVIVQDQVLNFGNSVTWNLIEDNIYTITINDLEYIILADCGIRECKKKLLREFLCDEEEGCCNKINDLSRFSILSAIVYKKWSIWREQQTIYSTLDINDIVDTVTTLKAALEKIKEICKDCSNDKANAINDCGCN